MCVCVWRVGLGVCVVGVGGVCVWYVYGVWGGGGGGVGDI